MLEIVGIWIATLLISVLSDKIFMLESYKIVANYGYKNKCNNLYDLPEEMISISKDATLIPIYNILARMYAYAYIKRNLNAIIEKLIDLDIIEEMTEEEKNEYLAAPTSFRAILIYLESEHQKEKIQSIEMVIDGKYNKISYRVSDDSKYLEILEVTGPLKDKGLSKKEIESVILNRWMELFSVGPKIYPTTFSKKLSENDCFTLDGIEYEDGEKRDLNVTKETFYYNLIELEKLNDYFDNEEKENDKVKVKTK